MAEVRTNPPRTRVPMVREVVVSNYDGTLASRTTEIIYVWIDWPYAPRESNAHLSFSDWRIATEETPHAE